MIKVETSALQETEAAVRRQAVRIRAVSDELSDIFRRLNDCGNIFEMAEASLRKESLEVNLEADKLLHMAVVIGEIADMYERCEAGSTKNAETPTGFSSSYSGIQQLRPLAPSPPPVLDTELTAEAFRQYIEPLLDNT